MRRRTPRWILVTVAALVLGVSVPVPSQAQQLPPIPLPPLPAELEPVLELVSPLVSPQCANATLVVILVPTLIGAGVPLDLSPLFGPVFTLCASVPLPDGASKLQCAIDDQVLGVVANVTAIALGTPPPVTTRLIGPVVEILALLEASLALPAGGTSPGALLSSTLACRPLQEGAPVPAPTTPTTASPASTEPTVTSGGGPAAGGPIATGGFVVPDIGGGTPPVAAPTAVLPVEPSLPISSTPLGFAYPAALVVPLVLLALGGYFARSLTGEVRLPRR